MIEAMRPGDLLVYSRLSFFGALIQAKTWSPYTHVEMVVTTAAHPSGVTCLGARSSGVRLYSFNPEGLVLARRAPAGFDIGLATAWVYREQIDLQGYDHLALLNFLRMRLTAENNTKQFCSEVLTRAYREGGTPIYPVETEPDTIAPRDLAINPLLTTYWRKA